MSLILKQEKNIPYNQGNWKQSWNLEPSNKRTKPWNLITRIKEMGNH